MAFTENFSDFINADTPGYVVAQILGADVEGIFNNDYANALGGNVGFESSEPELTCRESAVASAVDGTVVVINSTNYKVAEKNADGTGLTVVRLKK